LGNNNRPFLVNSLISHKIIQISCGDHHSAALNNNGELFTWGGGGQYNRGQCGHGDLNEYEQPKRVDFFQVNNKKVVKIACGGYHTIILSENNELFAFGKGTYGQLGYGGSEDSVYPIQVKFNKIYENFEKENSKFDNNKINMLDNLLELNTTMKMNNGNTTEISIKDIKCGGEHSIILSKFGRLYTFGHGYTGQLGLGNSKNYHAPMLVKSLLKNNIVSIAAGWSHSIILTDQNFLYVSGCGKYGELGLEDEENRSIFTLLKDSMAVNISKIFAGGHHSWIILDSKNPEKNEEIKTISPISNTRTKGFEEIIPKNLSPKNENKNKNEISKKNSSIITMQNIQKISEVKSKFEDKLLFDLDLLGGKISNHKNNILQVTYTDIKVLHRFIRFSIDPNSRFKDICFKDLNKLIGNFFEKERGLISYKLKDDNEMNFKNTSGNNNLAMDIISKEIKENFKLNLNKKNFYSIILIFDYTKIPDFLAVEKEIEDNYQIDINNTYCKKLLFFIST
jgi:alpha-tubulin suppressor-like RCC1 family protein